MKVVHIILGKSNPDRMNGVNRVVNQLATVQHQQGEEVQVWGITKDIEGEKPVVAYSLKLFQGYKNPFRMDIKLKEAIIKLAKNVVFHLHGGFVPVFYQVAKSIKKAGGKYIISPHGTYSSEAIKKSNKQLKKIYLNVFEKCVLENASFVHLLGESSDEGIKHYKISSKVIPNGFNIEEISVKKWYSHEIPVFGYVGRLSMYHKGLDLLIKGFKQYLEKGNPKARLWLVGDGEAKNALREMIYELGLRDNVIFWGSLFGKEKEELMQKMDFFVHTSRHEGLPTAMIEAAAFGIPLIGSKGTNFTTYIDEFDAGYSIIENQPENIAQTFLQAEKTLNQETYQNLSANARKLAVYRFDWKIIHHSFLEVYTAA